MRSSFRYIPFANIHNYEVRNISPIWDHGRMGLHYGLKGDTYNLSTKKGLLIEFMVGKSMNRIIIGSLGDEWEEAPTLI